MIDSFNEKLNYTGSGYDVVALRLASYAAIRQGWFTNTLNNYPPPLGEKDMGHLIERYIYLLRNIDPSKDIDEDHVLANPVLCELFNGILTDIARIGSARLIDYQTLVPFEGLASAKEKRRFTSDLTLFVSEELFSRFHSHSLIIGKGYKYTTIDPDLAGVREVAREIADILVNQLHGKELNLETEKLLNSDLYNILNVVICDKEIADLHFLKDKCATNNIVNMAFKLIALMNKHRTVQDANIKDDFYVFLGMNSAKGAFDHHAAEVIEAYIGLTFMHILLDAKESIFRFPIANDALTLYLNHTVKAAIKNAMLSPSDTVDLDDSHRYWREAKNYAKAHPVKTGAIVLATVLFGGVGLAGSAVACKYIPEAVNALKK